MNLDDDSFQALENRLRAHRPAPLPPELMARLRAARPAPRRVIAFPLLWTAAAAAAAIVTCTLAFHRPPPRPAPLARTAPADGLTTTSNQYLVGARKVGVWSAPDGHAYQVVQCLAVNRSVWRQPDGGERVELLEPQQRVLLLAMGTQ